MKLLNVSDISEVESVSEGICNYFTSNGILSQQDIVSLRAKIGREASTFVASIPEDSDGVETVYYTLDGFLLKYVPTMPGIYIKSCRFQSGTVSNCKIIIE